MKNISIAKSNNKLNLNINDYNTQYNITEFPINYGIYKYYYAINKNIDFFILDDSILNTEILSFMQENHRYMHFIIETQSKEIIQQYEQYTYKFITNVVDNNKTVRRPSFILNDTIYKDIETTEKTDQLVYFLDNMQNIPDHLLKNLYPNTKLPIKMFNGRHIQHYQHLGHINEVERKRILLESSVYLYTNTDYVLEAQICGCDCVDISEQFDLSNITDKITEYTTYDKFLKEILC